jgi:hypothetical protein
MVTTTCDASRIALPERSPWTSSRPASSPATSACLTGFYEKATGVDEGRKDSVTVTGAVPGAPAVANAQRERRVEGSIDQI